MLFLCQHLGVGSCHNWATTSAECASWFGAYVQIRSSMAFPSISVHCHLMHLYSASFCGCNSWNSGFASHRLTQSTKGAGCFMDHHLSFLISNPILSFAICFHTRFLGWYPSWRLNKIRIRIRGDRRGRSPRCARGIGVSVPACRAMSVR